MMVSSSILVQFVPLSMCLLLVVFLALHTAADDDSPYIYKFKPKYTTRPTLPPLHGPMCTQYCHKNCESFRYQVETEDNIWGTRDRTHVGGSEKVSECNDANRRCKCGPKPDTFLQSHCKEYCWEDCDKFRRAYGLDKVLECSVAQSRCTCGEKPLDVYRQPTNTECENLCHKKCNYYESNESYSFCLNAKPKCKSCGMNPEIGWIVGRGLMLLFCFGFFSCYLCQRVRARARPEAINVNQMPHPQIRGGGFLPVIPPTPERPLTPVRPYEPQTVPRNPSPRPSPSPDPARHSLIPVYPEPSAPFFPAASMDDDLPPSYDDVIKNY